MPFIFGRPCVRIPPLVERGIRNIAEPFAERELVGGAKFPQEQAPVEVPFIFGRPCERIQSLVERGVLPLGDKFVLMRGFVLWFSSISSLGKIPLSRNTKHCGASRRARACGRSRIPAGTDSPCGCLSLFVPLHKCYYHIAGIIDYPEKLQRK